ncbi:hypothetical protein EDB19DRAFT_238167 [Suillus lakei]|nr:hypothetical protein EDB19DRAFT_238167 [Suillus lakei]
MNVFQNRRRQATSSADPSPDGTSLSSLSSPASPPETWVDISSTDYAHRRRELMKMMSDLKSMGAEALIDLPSVVVIGGQSGLWSPPLATPAILNFIVSAGKSSLVEAVSGVRRQIDSLSFCPFTHHVFPL